MKPVFRLCVKRNRADCVIASLAMLLGCPYEEVLITAAQQLPDVLKKGLFSSETISIAACMGTPLKLRNTQIDLEEDCGILMLKFPNRCEHAVYLTNGLIFDSDRDGEIWDAAIYVKKFRPKLLHILEEEE